MFQIIFALQSTPDAANFEVSTIASMFDLSLFMWDGPNGVRGVFEYNTDLFDAATIEAMKDHFITLCAAAVADPGCAVARLPLLAAQEQEALLARVERHACRLSARFEHRRRVRGCPCAGARGDRGRDCGSEERSFPAPRLTYRELSRASGALAARLTALGIQPGMPVAMYLDRSMAAIVTILAILKAGAAYVPMSSDKPQPRTLEVLKNAGVGHVLTTADGVKKFAAFEIQAVNLEAEWDAAPG